MAELEAIHFRHQDVGDNQIEIPAFNLFERFQAVAGAGDLVPARADNRFDQVEVFGIVIDAENFHGGPFERCRNVITDSPKCSGSTGFSI